MTVHVLMNSTANVATSEVHNTLAVRTETGDLSAQPGLALRLKNQCMCVSRLCAMHGDNIITHKPEAPEQ